MQRLRELDRDRGWLAKQVGRDLSTVHRWISGARRPSERDLRDVALVLHRPVDWLTSVEPDQNKAVVAA